MEIVDLAHKYRDEGVVGIDLAGDDHANSGTPHIPAFKRAVELNIHRTVHAGETGSSESVRQAIEECFAERIGHGYAIVDDPKVYDLVRRNDIHVECCLTSSIQTNAIGKYIPKDSEKEEKHLHVHGQQTKTRLHSHIRSKKEIWHPIHHFARDSLNFSLSCDDPSVSQITIEHEYEHAATDLNNAFSMQHVQHSLLKLKNIFLFNGYSPNFFHKKSSILMYNKTNIIRLHI